jgi:hypothetical protein
MFGGDIRAGNPKSEVADMIDEDSDWISLDAAVAHVEATQQCYREKAIDLVRQAADNLKLKSRTVVSSPKWIVSYKAGKEIFHSDGGQRIEVCRQNVLELWPERQKDATRPAPAKIGSNAAQRRGQPISHGVRSAIKDLWPGGIPADLMAKERDEQIIQWLKDHNKQNISKNISRTIQRALKAEREAHKETTPD